jgi:hypothetical protein
VSAICAYIDERAQTGAGPVVLIAVAWTRKTQGLTAGAAITSGASELII